MDAKNPSRFSTLRVFKLAGSSKPPPPPPKDAPSPYNITPWISSSASTSQLTISTVSPDLTLTPSRSHISRSPTSDDARFLHPNSPITPKSPPSRSVSPTRSPPVANAFKKGFTKLTSFGKRPSTSRSQTTNIPLSPSLSALNEQPNDDEGISAPWNFQHNVHVNGDLHGLPPSWSASLAEAGFTEEEIAALRARQRQYIAPRPEEPPQFTPSQSTSTPQTNGVVTLVNPKPRNDSLRRPVPQRTVSTPRQPPSPTLSTATSTHTNTGTLAQEPPPQSQAQSTASSHSPAQSPIDSPAQSLSRSHSSGRSPPPAPLSLHSFRVINDDPTPMEPVSPPPAYVAPTPVLEKGPRRKSTEKSPLPGSHASTSGAPEPPQALPVSTQRQADPEVQQVVHPEAEVDSRKANADVEADVDAGEMSPEEDTRSSGALSELTIPPSPVPRAATLPPRLSLHTEQDDGWGDMFSFLPLGDRSSAAGPSSKRASVMVKPSTPPSSNRESVQFKRRSKRFVAGLAIAPTLYTHSDVDTTQSGASSSQPAVGDSPDTEASQREPSEPSSTTILYTPPRRTAEFGVFTPDPAYPIANSPLWEEVRMLVQEGGSGRTRPVEEEAKPVLESPEAKEDQVVHEAAPAPEPANSPSPVSSSPPSRSLSLHPPSPHLRSRFSDASDSPQPASRFSDASSFQGHSRFSEATSIVDSSHGTELRSRFSAWSTASHAHPSSFFSPLEGMPESPLKSPVAARPQQITTTFPPPRRSSEIPPPLPPPRDSLPPPPPEPQEDDYNLAADESHVSRLSTVSRVSSAQIHGARIATRTQVNIISPPLPSTTSSSGRSTSVSTPVTSPQNQRPPPLPLPPLGKILPSLIASQQYKERRRQLAEAEQGSQDSHDQSHHREDTGRASPASVGSSSSYSHSSSLAGSGIVFTSSFDNGNGDLRTLSTSATSYEDPPKSPMLAYLEDEPQRSPKPGVDIVRLSNETGHGGHGLPQSDEDEDEDTVPLSHIREKLDARPQSRARESHKQNSEDSIGIEDWLPEEQQSPEPVELEASLMDSPGIYDHESLPVTPSITVNGFAPPTQEGSSTSEPEPEFENGVEEEEEVSQELPLVLTPLREYIYLDLKPHKMFLDLQEVAEGQYGSVYAARVVSVASGGPDSLVAVKKVPVPANGTPKIGQLRHELGLVSQVRHKHILTMDGLFYDFAEDTLWIRMELMERSLADVLELGEDGLELDERVIGRFASDALLALAYLADLSIAHRDVRSDNLLINGDGVLKLADFSNAVRFSRQDPLRFEIVGVHYWQAPEIRRGGYDASLVDIWSLGATVWESAECRPPFSDVDDPRALKDRWPPLTRADAYSHDLHEFLRLCSEPPATRPRPSELLHNPFIQRACPREHILQVLHFCQELESAQRLDVTDDD